METRKLYGFNKKEKFVSFIFLLAEKTPFWNPFGRPGAGAPNSNENQARLSVCLLTPC